MRRGDGGREKRLRGIIFLGGQFDYTPADLALLNVPFVCCSYSNRYGTLAEGEYSSVSIADEETAREAVRELYRYGHRRIAALISRPDDQSISQLRYEGYVSALEELGLPFDPELVISTGGFNIKDAYNAVSEKLHQGAEFTALFAIADSMAIGAMRALLDAGPRRAEGLLRHRHRRAGAVGIHRAAADHAVSAHGGAGGGAAPRYCWTWCSTRPPTPARCCPPRCGRGRSVATADKTVFCIVRCENKLLKKE